MNIKKFICELKSFKGYKFPGTKTIYTCEASGDHYTSHERKIGSRIFRNILIFQWISWNALGIKNHCFSSTRLELSLSNNHRLFWQYTFTLTWDEREMLDWPSLL